MRSSLAWTLTVALAACGGRVEPLIDDAGTTGDFAPSDTGGGGGGGGGGSGSGGGTSDTGFGPAVDAARPDASGGGSDAGSPPDASIIPPDPGTGFRIVNLDVCPSAADVDKIIINVSEPAAKSPDAAARLHVKPGGTTCTAFDAGSSTGDYAFGAKCGLIDRTKPIVVEITDGLVSMSGAKMAAGTYVFHPAGKPGRVCGDEFLP